MVVNLASQMGYSLVDAKVVQKGYSTAYSMVSVMVAMSAVQTDLLMVE